MQRPEPEYRQIRLYKADALALKALAARQGRSMLAVVHDWIADAQPALDHDPGSPDLDDRGFTDPRARLHTEGEE